MCRTICVLRINFVLISARHWVESKRPAHNIVLRAKIFMDQSLFNQNICIKI